MRIACVVLSLVALVLVAGPADTATIAELPALAHAVAAAPAYDATITPLPPDLRAWMTGLSWHPGCPVGLGELRLIRLTYWGFDHAAHRGRLVVAARWARSIARVFGRLYNARFPIRRMMLVDRYGAKDMRSMRADNTSAFNCRYRDGVCCTWSEHAFGRAIDINPLENPYVGSWGVSPPNGAAYVDRSPIRRGMIARHDRVWWAFHAIEWSWGGQWGWPVDYQHFSATNR